MSTIRAALVMGAALVLTGGHAANAADLYGGGPSVKDGYVAPGPAGPSLYVRIDGGYGSFDEPVMVEDGIYDLVNTGIEETWTLGGGIGRYFTPTIRGDVTYDHRFEATAHGYLADGAATLPGLREFGVESDVVLFNAYYDFDRGGRFSPYLGVGLGVTHNKTTGGTVSDACGCTGVIDEGDETHVAAALMAGFTAKLRGGQQVVEGGIKDAPVVVESGRNLYLDVGYRFLYLGETSTGPVTMTTAGGVEVSKDPTVEDIHAHEVRVGLRYDLR